MPAPNPVPPAASAPRKPLSLTRGATLLRLRGLLLLSSSLWRAQGSAVAARTVADTPAQLADLGPLPVSQPMEVTLRLGRSDAQKTALATLLAEQIDPAAATYHHWLTPIEFGQQFGVSEEQLASITAWAEAQGLSISAVSPARTRIVLTGTAGQINRAFATELHRLSVSGSN